VAWDIEVEYASPVLVELLTPRVIVAFFLMADKVNVMVLALDVRWTLHADEPTSSSFHAPLEE